MRKYYLVALLSLGAFAADSAAAESGVDAEKAGRNAKTTVNSMANTAEDSVDAEKASKNAKSAVNSVANKAEKSVDADEAEMNTKEAVDGVAESAEGAIDAEMASDNAVEAVESVADSANKKAKQVGKSADKMKDKIWDTDPSGKEKDHAGH